MSTPKKSAPPPPPAKPAADAPLSDAALDQVAGGIGVQVGYDGQSPRDGSAGGTGA